MRSKSVSIDVQGGIGNQLFMYFAGLYWAQANNVELVVNVGKIGVYGIHHGSGLDEFQLRCQIIGSKPSSLEALYCRIKKWLLKSRFGLKLDEIFAFRTYYSPEVGYDEKLAARKRLKKIEGYFQTYKYFDALDSQDLKILKLRKTSFWFEETLRELQESPFIAVHVRRGDFKKFSKNVGLLSNDYYADAIQELDLLLGGNFPIIVFSDEPETAKIVLKAHELRVNRWISQPVGSSPIESLLLMSEAHAIVIANSTYSWWAAKLGRSKLVVAPKQWFRMGETPKDLYPNDWQLVTSSWET